MVLEPADLRKELESRGVILLGVGQHRANPRVLVVYLHANAGQWQDGFAERQALAVPGVISVVPSVPSPAILLVQVEDQTQNPD